MKKEALLQPEINFPLRILVCDTCYLVQIEEYASHSDIFSSDYAYFSSYSSSWLAHAKRYTENMIERFGFNSDSQIIELASNDGYLLQYFKEKNIPVLGIEPTANTAKVAEERGIKSIVDFLGLVWLNFWSVKVIVQIYCSEIMYWLMCRISMTLCKE